MVNALELASAVGDGPVCCEGSMPPEAPITICYRQQSQDGSGGDLWRSIALPPGDGIQDLAAACSEASFGIGGERVMDPSYRKALKLEPGDFTTSFDLSGYGILDEIKTLLFPTKQTVIAKLYKLNVYAQGDFFKPHVDTPQSGNMLASLVVSLPCAHSGGDLVVRHGKKSHSFSFGGENGNGRIGWAAFFSDCEHEVMEVTSGHRLTLTYNLFVENSTTPKTDFSSTQLYKLFVEAKESGQKMTLGFPCKHLYAQGSGLKGDDAFVYHTAVAAGLKASVCSVWSRENGFRASRRNPDFDHPKFIGDEDMLGRFLVSGYAFYREEVEIAEIGELLHEEMEEDVGDVVWCRENFEWNVGGACASYGNEPGTESFYCAAAILVSVDDREDEANEDDADENEDDPNTNNDTMEDDANEGPN